MLLNINNFNVILLVQKVLKGIMFMQKSNSIVESVFDIFFETTAITENFLGLIEQVDEFEVITKLPILQIPEAIRKNDPNFKFQPLYEIAPINSQL